MRKTGSKNRILLMSVVMTLFALFLTACGTSRPDTGTMSDIEIVDATTRETTAEESESSVAETTEQMTEEEKTEVTATEEQTESTDAETTENAEYTEYHFKNRSKLNDHYEKHGIEMGFDSAEAYEKAASDVVNNPAALHKKEAEDGDDVYYVEATNEFVVVSKQGYIRTYFLPSRGIDYYNSQ